MIENLNRLSFQAFGSTLPDMPDITGWAQPWTSVTLTAGSAPAWQTKADLWLFCDSGMAVLSVSTDGNTYYDFYMDKSVKIRSGIFFSIAPFYQQATVRYCSPAVPEEIPARTRQSN